jgi:hypothetical protein
MLQMDLGGRRMSESKIKTTSRSLPGILAICLIAALALPPNSAQAQQIWFSPSDDLEVKGVVAHPDFVRLFDSKSPWPTGLGRVNVMQLRSPWFLRMPPDTDQKVVEFVKQHNIALAVPFGFVNSENCGQRIEGLGSARQHNVYPREMKKRGIPLDYAVMADMTKAAKIHVNFQSRRLRRP